MKFKIRCEVYGGITGHRTGYLKRDDKEMIFTSREEAEKNLPQSKTTERGVTFNYAIEECRYIEASHV